MRILAISSLFVCCSLVSGVCSGEVTQNALREFTDNAIAQKYFPILFSPKFDWDGEFLTYSLGNVGISGDLLPGGGEHAIANMIPKDLLIPVNAQFQISLIRKTRDSRKQRRFWEPVLRKAEQKVAEMLHLINQGDIQGKQLSDALWKKDSEIYAIFQTELNKLARREGKRGAQRAEPCACPPRYDVAFSTNPTGGTIKIVSLGNLKFNEFLQDRGLRIRELDWMKVHENIELSIGKYRVHCEWPGQVSNDNIHIVRGGQEFVFSPD